MKDLMELLLGLIFLYLVIAVFIPAMIRAL